MKENDQQFEQNNTAEDAVNTGVVKRRRLPLGWIEKKEKRGSRFAKEVYQEAFTFFDPEETGEISTDDLYAIFTAFRMEPSELALKDLLYDIDFAGTERLQLEQFCYLMDCLLSKKSMHEEIQDAFRQFDRDNDGLISAWELKRVLRVLGEQVSEEKAEEMIAERSQGGSGKYPQLPDVYEGDIRRPVFMLHLLFQIPLDQGLYRFPKNFP
ncbi:neo-calmodulin-like [Symsagittifera roscoffensis]|uniref:neo-calmodulin-like n=1 Tax=Symsagittifera roscoffensis TaxID=84072 RepID=UPI00307BA76E